MFNNAIEFNTHNFVQLKNVNGYLSDLCMLSYFCIFCRFEDVIDVQIHNRNVAQINFKDRSVVFYTNRVINKYSFVNVKITNKETLSLLGCLHVNKLNIKFAFPANYGKM